ncbi:DUF397 domain-containing protein [Streptomyces hesseae]|uniref:DUF397 domain-containing protein n=1 Tax=Streptomyces hesseae TaxID=3075519 RepID=A0ABU2SJ37_9ACTN|nr:DUF397 domain-containing protein [Streptomyces sp. DSM 40473]MDT0448991.1 DUF397 domain-containing protein [Streptomyces sp. DSM 40473]
MKRTLWQKSSFSGPDNNPDCLELAATSGAILMRESDAPSVVIATAHTRVRALLASVKEGALQ